MQAAIMLLVLAISPAELRGGEVLVLENCNSVVEGATAGDTGHVALVLRRVTGLYVAEAAPAEVRVVAWDDYLAELAKHQNRRKKDEQMRVWLIAPDQPLSREQKLAIEEHVASQVGRRYSVLGYLASSPAQGVHCAQFTAECLTKAGRVEGSDWHRVSPTKLVAQLDASYGEKIPVELPPYVVSGTWCERSSARWREIAAWWRWSLGEVATLLHTGPRPAFGFAW